MSDRLFVICVGGSGAKCFESIIQLAAAGMYSKEQIEVLFVDSDESNGSVERARRSLVLYQECQQLVGGKDRQNSIPWMQTPINSYGLWSPFEDYSEKQDLDLAKFFRCHSMDSDEPSLANLFNAFYSNEERYQQLDEGFRGRPSIGAAVMSQINLEQLNKAPWGTLIQEIKNAANGQGRPRILLCGSIFGGTGASGIPTIARLLDNKFTKEGIRDSVNLGGLFLLPYFGFTLPPGAETDGMYASTDQFLLNTEAALRFYKQHASDLFDTVYLLGNRCDAQVDFSVGRMTQSNPPHFVELYAALAARDFLFQDRQDSLMLVARGSSGALDWEDLPESPIVKKNMVNASRLAYLWLSDMQEELESIRQGLDRIPPWAKPFYDATRDDANRIDTNHQQSIIKTIADWSRDHLRWIKDIHQSDANEVKLFNIHILGDLANQIRKKELSTLVIGDSRDPNKRAKQDEPRWIKEELRKKGNLDSRLGAVGLATSLYISSSI
jgi:hypothetical protein